MIKDSPSESRQDLSKLRNSRSVSTEEDVERLQESTDIERWRSAFYSTK